MRRLFAFILATILISSVFVSAADFTLTAQNYNADVCRGSTSTITTSVNTAGAGSFSVSATGSAGAFTTAVPESFSLDANGKQNVYAYVNPPSNAKEGAYTLVLEVNSDGQIKSETYNIKVKDCHGSSLSVDIGSKLSCSCEKVTYNLNLENNGNYVETFDLSVSGSASKWANLSTNIVSLASGEKRSFSATVSPACEVYGTYDLVFKAKSRNSLSSSTTSTSLKINPCYEYSIIAPSENMTICEGKPTEIPLIIRNTGTASNTFTLSAGGPNWAYFKNSSIMATAGGDASINLTVNPAKSTEGKIVEVKIDAVSNTGSVEKTTILKTIVDKCYSILLETDEKNYICDLDESYAFDLNIQNFGKENDAVELTLDAPEWVTLTDRQFVVTSGKNRTTGIIAKVPIRTGLGTYPVTINAKSNNGASASVSKEIVLAEPATCYSSNLEAENGNNNFNVLIESGKTFILNLENKGLDKATYLIDLKGSASDFSTINPTNVEISPGMSEKLYLYISPPLFTEIDSYDLTVGARAKGSDVSSSVILKVNVGNLSNSLDVLAEDSIESSEPGFFSKLWSSFVRLFSREDTQEQVNSDSNESQNVISSEDEEQEMIYEDSEKDSLETEQNASLSQDDANVTINGTSFVKPGLEDLMDSSEQKKFSWNEHGKYLFGAAAIVVVVLLLLTGWGRKTIEFFEEE